MKQPDRRGRPSKNKAERILHAPGRSDRNAVTTCRPYLAGLGQPLTSDVPLAADWQVILDKVTVQRRNPCELVIGILLARGISPADLTMTVIEDLIAEIEREHRRTALSGSAPGRQAHEVQRAIRAVFTQCVNAWLALRANDPSIGYWSDLRILPSSFELQEQRRQNVPRQTKRLIDGIMRSSAAETLAQRVRSRYTLDLYDCAVRLQQAGISVVSRSDFWQPAALDALCADFEADHVPAARCASLLHVLRFAAKIKPMDLGGIKRIQDLTRAYRSRLAGGSHLRNLPLVARIGEDTNFVNLIGGLLRAAGGVGTDGQSRQRIARASGACLCLIQLMSGVRLAQLVALSIIYDPDDGSPSIKPTISPDMTERTRTLPNVLALGEVDQALNAFCALFFAEYGRMPKSLLDGLLGPRAQQASAQARMALVLADLAPGMTPGMLRDLLVWRLIPHQSPARLYRILGYGSYLRFKIKYAPLIALANAKKLIG
ncbi:hypothetical protein [Rhabdaerophilum sp. SD176]|uniref:hypothetical protein n=1 Tax=Rhabdaerophilum sp. SD176 TaxID=2983548 RepID=UPI0024DFE46D|nr:hypothetical protein [Rhabdaerophilum sp. SD176]